MKRYGSGAGSRQGGARWQARRAFARGMLTGMGVAGAALLGALATLGVGEEGSDPATVAATVTAMATETETEAAKRVAVKTVYMENPELKAVLGEARRLAAQIASRLGEWGDRGQAPVVGRGEWGELLGWTRSLEELLAGAGRGQGRGEAAAMDGDGEEDQHEPGP